MHAKGIRRAAAGLAAAAALAGLAGCNHAELENVWRDPQYDRPPMQAVLVVAEQQGESGRRLMEDAVQAEMSRHGVNAVVSYRLFPDRPPGRDAMAAAMQDQGLDGALVLRRLTPTHETRWVPGWTSIEPRTYYDPWSDGSVLVYRRRRHRGYAVTDTYVREEFTLWAGPGDMRMVWAGTVVITNPESPAELRQDLATGVVPEMRKEGFLPKNGRD